MMTWMPGGWETDTAACDPVMAAWMACAKELRAGLYVPNSE